MAGCSLSPCVKAYPWRLYHTNLDYAITQAAPFSVLNDSPQDYTSSTVLESLTSSYWTETDFRENRPDGKAMSMYVLRFLMPGSLPLGFCYEAQTSKLKTESYECSQKKKTDHFLRVTFCNEDGEDLSYDDRVSNDNVFARYRRVLLRGITVAGRRFQFLAFSHSSLRSHSA